MNVIAIGVEYSTLMHASVMSLKAFLEILTNPNLVFISQDMPVQKHASSLCIHSLKVVPCHLPIIWIWVLE
jgi:hypothetical protein